MDAVVQLIRNFLCCCKDLGVFEGTFIHDAVTTRQFLGDILPEPLDKTTPLEVLTSVTQLFACISVSWSGATLIATSVGKMRRVVRILDSRLQGPTKDWTHADKIVNESLMKAAKYALRSSFIGFLLFPLGVAFFWITCNSWHITETDWIGGLPGLIYALTIMELVLLPLLYYMIVDGFEMLAKSKRCQELSDIIDQGKLSQESIGVHRYEAMTGWEPFWDSGVSLLSSAPADEDKKVDAEIAKVQGVLASWFPKDAKKGEKEEKISAKALEGAIDKLEDAIPQLRMEGYREFLYFLFNFFAFYGYLVALIPWYFEDEEAQPYPIQSMKMGYNNAEIEWHGNFAGDLMWTLEPIVILGSPLLISMLKPARAKKVKAD